MFSTWQKPPAKATVKLEKRRNDNLADRTISSASLMAHLVSMRQTTLVGVNERLNSIRTEVERKRATESEELWRVKLHTCVQRYRSTTMNYVFR